MIDRTDYVELHCHSNFSLLDGASQPEDLVARAAELGLGGLALTDHDAVYAAPRFARAAQVHGIQPIYGAELTLATDQHLTLLVENEKGWRNLCRLISLAQHNAPKGQAALPPDKLVDHTEGLIALSGCKKGVVAAHLRHKEWDMALEVAGHYCHLFGPGNFWIELQHHLGAEDTTLVKGLVEVARRLGLGYVATNNVHYASRSGQRLQDVLVCIRHNLSLEEAGPLLRPNSEFYLKPSSQLLPLFADYPAALTNTRRIAERCRFALQYGLQDLPQFPRPAGGEAIIYLRQLCQEAMRIRYPDPSPRVQEQLAYESNVIEQAGLANYFLIVWDIVRFARDNDIRCQGRGSAANSLVAYLLGISPIDPLQHDLVFERFLSDERQVVPDIDIDFDAERREEVIQYVYRKYGPEHTAMACTFVTFRKRAALRDLAKVLGLSHDVVAAAKLALETAQLPEPAKDTADQTPWRLLIDLCQQLEGVPRHVGIHNGGMLLTGRPLLERVPTEPATMTDRVVVQWDKDALENVGLVKVDILGLRMISAITETVNIVKNSTGQRPDLDNLAFNDPAVYDMISKADTIGAFQVESRAQAQMLPRLRPQCFNDLVVAISLIRPGPIQGNMVQPYLRRRLGLEPVSYLHPLLEPALAETLGVILFQEQVLKVARDLAGFSAGQGELLRRALGAKRAEAEIEGCHAAFIAGAQAKAVPVEMAEAVFNKLRAFGGYSFAKSHAASFAVLVYQSAWLKLYYPAAFYVGLLNNQPMGFWSPAVLVGEAQRHGISVLPVDLARSAAVCTVEENNIRLGFNYVAGLGEASVDKLVQVRQQRPFSDLADFCRRSRLARRLVENLILAGAMTGWGQPRRNLIWELGQLHYPEEELELVFPVDAIELPRLTKAEAMLLERGVLGLSTGDHVMRLYRPWLRRQNVLGTRDMARCARGQRVRLAGLVVVHQSPPTAKGFHFITLEDENGLIDIIVPPQIYTRYRRLLRTVPLLAFEGEVQREGQVVNLLAQRAAALPRSSDQP